MPSNHAEGKVGAATELETGLREALDEKAATFGIKRSTAIRVAIMAWCNTDATGAPRPAPPVTVDKLEQDVLTWARAVWLARSMDTKYLQMAIESLIESVGDWEDSKNGTV